MRHPTGPHDARPAGRIMPTAGQVAEAQLQIAGLREQANRVEEMITGLALLRDGVDQHPGLAAAVATASLDTGEARATANLRDGLHILLTAWGGKLQAERAYLLRLAEVNEHNLALAQSGLVVPQ